MPLQDDSQITRVTVVDDEPCALDVLVRAAHSWHYQCQAANSAEEALDLLEKSLTPIVVTDVRMPGKGGVWLVREIHQRWPEVGIIVITGGQQNDSVLECLEAGAHHFFLKPINLDEFFHALERASRTFHLHRENNIYREYLEATVHRQTSQIRQTFLSAINSLVRLLEARDSYTSGHSRRVRDRAVQLARKMGLPSREIKRISLAARLHDIGKVGLPESILNKPGPLSREEFDLVKEHPVMAQRILSPVVRSRQVLAAIRSHHERFDGLGYPDGLRGQEISLLARVIAVADCYDAMTSSRAYRQAMSISEAIAILRAGAGSQFDPELVPLFVEMVLRS